MSRETICVVCSGNICRSPYGEVALASALAVRGHGERFTVISAGTLGIYDRPAHEHSKECGQERGVDLSAHRSQGVSKKIVTRSSLILGMSPGHVEEVAALFPEAAHKTHLFGSYPRPNDPEHDIPDPIGEPIEVYRECFDAIDDAIARIVEALVVR